MKNSAAVRVAVMQGRVLSAEPRKFSLISMRVKKSIAATKPAIMIINMTMPGIESRYWVRTSVMVRPVQSGVQVVWPVML